MGKKRKLRSATLTQEELASWQEMNNALSAYVAGIDERQDGLLKLLQEYGPKRFTWILTNVLIEKEREKGFAPDPRFYPELGKKLEQVRSNGWPVDGLNVIRMENAKSTYDLRIILPLQANIKAYLHAIEAYQDYFQSLGSRLTFPKYVVGRYTEGIAIAELIDEINEGITDWSQGKFTLLNWFGLNDYLISRGRAPESLRQNEDLLHTVLFDEERLRRLIRYHRTGK